MPVNKTFELCGCGAEVLLFYKKTTKYVVKHMCTRFQT